MYDNLNAQRYILPLRRFSLSLIDTHIRTEQSARYYLRTCFYRLAILIYGLIYVYDILIARRYFLTARIKKYHLTMKYIACAQIDK